MDDWYKEWFGEGKVLFCGITLDEVIGMYSQDIVDNLGEPVDWGDCGSDDYMLYGVYDSGGYIVHDDGWVTFKIV